MCKFFSTVVKVRWVGDRFHAWIVGSCLAIEVWHPEWIIPYPNPWAQ
ncbi:MAG: hypothetical protein HC919_11960, partial [Oscillatoriales cyanobacterium SM2_2_1]|nr:hypothetical protein [Oscillatoriales cyanobacterium SM2_2_1]